MFSQDLSELLVNVSQDVHDLIDLQRLIGLVVQEVGVAHRAVHGRRDDAEAHVLVGVTDDEIAAVLSLPQEPDCAEGKVALGRSVGRGDDGPGCIAEELSLQV